VADVFSLSQGLPERRFAAGEELLGEGTHSGQLLVLIEGVVSVRRQGVAFVHLRDPGVFIGEIAALLGRAHTASVVAETPTRCYVIENAATNLAEHPDLLLGVARLLAQRLSALTAYLVDIKRQYGEEDGHLALMDEVLTQLMSLQPVTIEPGSARPDVPDY
jgi:CRP/FNR family cyclic AMP-dependent transcriptional regulator